MKKRLCAGLLFIVMIISVGSLPAAVYAENDIEWEYPALYLSAGDGGDSLKDAVDLEALESYLFENFRTCAEEIDISSFGVPFEYEEKLRNYIWNEMPGAFHVYGLGCGSDSSGNVTILYANYDYDAETYNEMYEKCLDAADVLLDGIKNNSDLSEIEKALLIHDRLAIHCEYDYENYLNGSLPPESYTIYGALVSRKAVCQGYSESYAFLLDMVGIDSYLCESKTLYHAWNIVYIGGKPFHVDVTWDDPVRDVNGRVNHNNFLRSNDGIYSAKHYASDYDTPAVYDDYENAAWLDNNAGYVLLGNEIYFIDAIERSREASLTRLSDGKVLADLTDSWTAGGTQYWMGNYSRLATDGKYLYYNSAKAFYRFDTETNTSELIFAPDLSAYTDYSIYGMRYERGKLIYDIWNKPNFDAETPTDLEYVLEAVPTVGDINGDRVVDTVDLVALAQVIADGGKDEDFDINGDGTVDTVDLVALASIIAG